MPKGSIVAVDTRIEEKIYPVDASKYKLLEEVGNGVSAIVYRAQCIPLKEYVAIKTLDLDRCNCNLDDVRREAQTMSLINHANVVKACCSFVVGRSLWVVMPYMSGGSCLHIMKSAYPDGFDEPVIASFLKETLKALEYLHNQGHIHRDVKAGNILVDGNGVVKLADFGVSACMFDTGDRLRSRKTFVGTPCWMAPEVMEQVNGYDFKADIWSFGITALELAHGHAPFSKFPPMKVLLMTLQNAPPGLDYERDRRFSKSFKEMIAMCLVKDPSKRPSAEKLLKHSFFKQAKSPDYLVRTILSPLPPLWDRVNDLKEKEAARLAQKKMPYNEQEERSQNEYKRGVSSWNFDLEELKNQAALDDTESLSGQTDTDTMEICRSSVSSSDYDVHFSGPLMTTQFTKGPDAGERAMRVQSAPLPSPSSLQTGSVFLRSEQQSHTTKKPPKHFGRFNVFEDDPDQDSKDLHDSPRVLQENLDAKQSAPGVHEAKQLDTEENVLENGKGQKPEIQYGSGENQERAPQTLDCSDAARDVDRFPASEESSPSRPIRSTVLPYSGVSQDNLVQNGASGLSRPNGMGVVQRKGRFSVTSHETDTQETGSVPSSVSRNTTAQASPLHKSASVSDGLERKNMTNSQLALQVFPSGLSATNAMKQLQNLFNQTSIQQELIVGLMNSINVSDQPVENSTGYRPTGGAVCKTLSRCNTMGSVDSMCDFSSDRVRELLSQVAELQCRVATLAEDLQAAKSRNAQLERQLNAIYNKEEEERIRREEAAASDDG